MQAASSLSPPVAAQSRLAALDGIRALAILGVFVFHTTSISGYPLDWLGPFATPVVSGWMGVDLFFAMSGFLITRLWLDEERAQPGESAGTRVKRFYARRSLRILPLYYFTLAAFVLLPRVATLPTLAPFAARVARHPMALAPYALFYANYVKFGGDGPLAVRWSLCVEEHFYLLWPVVLLLVRDRRRRLAVAAFACAALLAVRSLGIEYGGHRTGWASYSMVRYASHMRIDAILWGCVAALAFDTLVAMPHARRGALALTGAAMAALVASGETSVLHAPTVLGTGLGSSLLAVVAALVSAEVAAAPRSWLARALALPPLPTLGFHSYAMYLVHPLAIDLAVKAVFGGVTEPTLRHWVGTLTLSMALALLVAVALHATVDRPFRRLRARLRLAAPA